MNITEKLVKIKAWKGSHGGQTMIIIAIIILVSVVSFSLGKASNKSVQIDPIVKDLPQDHSLADPDVYKPGSLAAAVMNGSLEPQNAPELAQSGVEGTSANQGQNTDITTPRYVSSKNGRVYYFTWCAGAKRILEENRIYYKNSADARAAGLNPSSACPGLD